jgi:hypothetical protein
VGAVVPVPDVLRAVPGAGRFKVTEEGQVEAMRLPRLPRAKTG